MKEVRIIHYSANGGSGEGVYFTEDFDTPADDFIPYGWKVESDRVGNCDLPSNFPFETNLERQ